VPPSPARSDLRLAEQRRGAGASASSAVWAPLPGCLSRHGKAAPNRLQGELEIITIAWRTAPASARHVHLSRLRSECQVGADTWSLPIRCLKGPICLWRLLDGRCRPGPWPRVQPEHRRRSQHSVSSPPSRGPPSAVAAAAAPSWRALRPVCALAHPPSGYEPEAEPRAPGVSSTGALIGARPPSPRANSKGRTGSLRQR